MTRTLAFRQLEAAAERVIALGHSMKDRHLDLEGDVQKLERDKALAIDQLAILAESLLANFPRDISAEDLSRGEGVVEVTLRLLGELTSVRNQIACLYYFLKANFSGDVNLGETPDAIIGLSLELLGELKEHRKALSLPKSQRPPPEGLSKKGGRPTGPRPPVTPSKPQGDKQ